MKIHYFLIILLGVYALSSNAAVSSREANRYLYDGMAKLEEFKSLSRKGLGSLAKRSLQESMGHIEKLMANKEVLNPQQLELLLSLEKEIKQKSTLEMETIGTCDYRNIEHFKELDKLKKLKEEGSILSFNTYKDLYLLKAKEVKGCAQYGTWLKNFNEISV